MESNMRLKYKDLVRFCYFSVILSSHQTQTEILNFPDKRPKNEDNNRGTWKDRMHLDVPDKGNEREILQ